MFLDIKLGFLWSVIVALVFDLPISITLIGLGVLFALLPDLDFWIEYALRGTVGGKHLGAHRTLLHNPLTYTPIALAVAYFFGSAWATLFSLGVFGHFIHDSMGMGYGVRWLWPFSLRWYKFFSNKEGTILFDFNHILTSWSPEEMETLLKEKGNDDWLTEELSYIRTNISPILAKIFISTSAIVLFLQIIQYLS